MTSTATIVMPALAPEEMPFVPVAAGVPVRVLVGLGIMEVLDVFDCVEDVVVD